MDREVLRHIKSLFIRFLFEVRELSMLVKEVVICNIKITECSPCSRKFMPFWRLLPSRWQSSRYDMISLGIFVTVIRLTSVTATRAHASAVTPSSHATFTPRACPSALTSKSETYRRPVSIFAIPARSIVTPLAARRPDKASCERRGL